MQLACGNAGPAKEADPGAEKQLEGCCSGALQILYVKQLPLPAELMQAAAEEHRAAETHQLNERRKKYLQSDPEFVKSQERGPLSTCFTISAANMQATLCTQ